MRGPGGHGRSGTQGQEHPILRIPAVGFCGNLQIGYTAEVDGDDRIVLDREELETAFFISREELEMNPVRPALTQEMIEAFRLGKIR